VADVPSTPNHAVRDVDVRLIYIAADDGLYKYLIDAGEVVMMKAVGEGAP